MDDKADEDTKKAEDEMPGDPFPNFRLLCVMTHHALDRLGPTAEVAEIVAELKATIVAAHLAYPPPDYFTAVVDAVLLARSKGYPTPRSTRV